MTTREARRERRELERKAARLAYKAAKTATTEIGFVSHNEFTTPEPPPNALPINLPNEPETDNHPEIEFVSQEQRADVNRRNSQFSSGPRTPAGKLASSRNAFKHGLASGQLIIAGEDPAAFADLFRQLLADNQPANLTEKLLVEEMAQSWWLKQRAVHLQNGCFTPNGVDQKQLSLFLRYHSTHQRSFYQALKTLTVLQKERARAQPGFVSQPAVAVPVDRGFVSQNNLSAASCTASRPDENGFVSQNDPKAAPRQEFVRQNPASQPSAAARQAA